ncbi:MAG TPA: crossover junction endodeoxyribonuclease RuvC [Gemmatimonadota bacterium]|nr:crossover junction endodeoxyribonuclease RuvC [Gemmatimonadota bacterium]
MVQLRGRREGAAGHGVQLRVLGVDPGSAATGYGLVVRADGGLRLVECGVVRPDGSEPLPRRLAQIHEGLDRVLDRLEPTCVAVEDIFQGRNARTAAVLGHVRGAILLTAALRGLEVAEYPPASIKKAVVGNGNAGKGQVAFMVQKHLGLREPPEPADAADGCAAALCHLLVGTGPLAR